MERLSPKDFGSVIDSIEFQKTYLFKIHLPKIELNGFILEPKEFFELCTASTAFPIMSSDVQSVAFYNSELKFQTKVKYQNWSATFRLDTNNIASTQIEWEMKEIKDPLTNRTYKIRVPSAKGTEKANTYRYFYNWQMSGYDTNTRTANFPINYKEKVSLFLLDEQAKEIPGSSFTLEGVFPVQISGGNLSHADDGIVTFNVDFAFDRYIVPAKDVS
jgi:hypothetical protein